MKQSLKKWTIRITSTIVLMAGILIGIILNPSLLYANKSEVEGFIVYHNEALKPEMGKRLVAVREMLEDSDFYNPEFKLKICLNDEALYPKLMGMVRKPAFGWGFLDIVVLQGVADYKMNTIELNGYKWNLEQLFAHEAIHCYQYDKLGLWNSKPLMNHPNWKWEGYPEYVSRKNDDQIDLRVNIERLIEQNKEDPDSWAISFADHTISSVDYYKDWLLVMYCLDIEQLSYDELLKDQRDRALIEKDMWDWYNGK